MKGYCIKKTGRYNYSVTMPKWLVDQFNTDTVLYWHYKDGKIYLDTESEDENEPKERVRRLKNWTMTLDLNNPNIALTRQNIFGFSRVFKNYFWICKKYDINMIGNKSEILLRMTELKMPLPPEELLNELDDYIEQFPDL